MTRLFPLALLLAACGSEATPEDFVELGIEAQNPAGGRAVIACEPLPFLHGSRRHTEHIVDGAFVITVFTSPEEARLRFDEGARAIGDERVIPRETLAGDYQEQVQLLLGGGSAYTVTISSECGP